MALPPGASSSTGLGVALGVEALGEVIYPWCSLPLVVWGLCCSCGLWNIGTGILGGLMGEEL